MEDNKELKVKLYPVGAVQLTIDAKNGMLLIFDTAEHGKLGVSMNNYQGLTFLSVFTNMMLEHATLQIEAKRAADEQKMRFIKTEGNG